MLRHFWLCCAIAVLAAGCSGPAEQPTPTEVVTTEPTEAPTEAPTEQVFEAGAMRTDEFGVTQVYVPAGCFMMGADPTTDPQAEQDEQPVHETCLTAGYWIDQTEVTNESFQAFVDAGGYTTQEYWSAKGWEWIGRQGGASLPKPCDESEPEMPRACITWWEAEAYSAWRGGHLPTEAEWEYAARGPEKQIYPWGNEFDASLTNLVGSTAAVAVGSYPDGASWVGALDMAGNLMEWVQDWHSLTYYGTAPKDNPPGPAEGTFKVERGGWWGYNEMVARTTYRHNEDTPSYQDHHIGFRVVTAEE
jgi:formylglycine-generating enzyme required for sulfatase activity